MRFISKSKHVFIQLLAVFCVSFASSYSHAQITLGFQGGEPGDTWTYTSSGASALSQSEAASAANKVTGTTSLVAGGNTGGGNCFASGSGNGPDVLRNFSFDQLDISSSNYFGRNLTFNWGNRFPQCVGTGWDGGEDLIFQAFLDGVAQAPIIVIAGNNNAQFDIHTHAFSYSIPTCVNTFSFTIGVTTNRADELLFIDNVKLLAPQLNPPSSQPSAISGPTNLCVGATASYSVTAISGISFLWSGLPVGANFTSANGTTGSSTIGVNWGTAAAGTYNLSVGALDACGNGTSPQTIAVELVGAPNPVVISGPTSICNGQTAQLSSSVGTGITWSTGAATQIITINTPGVYTVNYTTTCGTTPTSFTVSTNNGPEITSVTVVDVTCFGGQNGSLTVNSIEPDLQYSIDGTNWQSSNTFGSLQAGTYTVSVQSVSGCTSSATVIVEESNALLITISATEAFCEGQPGTIHASVNTSGSFTILWDGPNGYSSSILDPSDIIENGTYTITVNDNSCTSTASINVFFGAQPIVNFSADAVCYGTESEFFSTSTVAAPDEIEDWLWTFGDGQSSPEENPSHLYSSTGVYAGTLTVTSSSGCSASLSQDIEVMQTPIADFSFSPNLISVSDPTVQFTNSSEYADVFLWRLDDAGSVSAEISPVFTYPQVETNYTVTLIATAWNGCVDSVTRIVTIGEGLIYYVPNSFTPNSDGFNDEFFPVFTSGIDEENVQLTLFNRWGEILFETTDPLAGWNGTFQNEPVQDGTYVWVIRFKNKNNDAFQETTGHVTLFR